MSIKNWMALTPAQVRGLYPKAFDQFANWFNLLDVSMKDILSGTVYDTWDNTRFYLAEAGDVYAVRPDKFVMNWCANEGVWCVNSYTEFLHKEVLDTDF